RYSAAAVRRADGASALCGRCGDRSLCHGDLSARGLAVDAEPEGCVLDGMEAEGRLPGVHVESLLRDDDAAVAGDGVSDAPGRRVAVECVVAPADAVQELYLHQRIGPAVRSPVQSCVVRL